jgi:hypothetical protein
MPLSLAAGNGHDAMVKQLLATDGIDEDSNRLCILETTLGTLGLSVQGFKKVFEPGKRW